MFTIHPFSVVYHDILASYEYSASSTAASTAAPTASTPISPDDYKGYEERVALATYGSGMSEKVLELCRRLLDLLRVGEAAAVAGRLAPTKCEAKGGLGGMPAELRDVRDRGGYGGRDNRAPDNGVMIAT